jgi:hypothetical protein
LRNAQHVSTMMFEPLFILNRHRSLNVCSSCADKGV